MAGIKISALPAVSSALLTDFFPVVQGGVTSQETLTQVLAAFQGQITSLGTQTQALNMGGFQINNGASPSLSTDYATKGYVDSIATGGAALVYAATTANLTITQAGAGVGATLTNAGAQAAFTLDGTTPPLNSRILVKNQSTTSQNGVYTLTNAGSVSTNWVLTRATDYDTPTDINDTGIVPVQNGTANANTGWVNTTLMVTVDTTAVTFTQFGVSYPVSVANGGTGLTSAANSSIFVSSSGGVPSWSTTVPAFTTSSITFNPTTGGIVGTTTNDNAAAGKVGEFVSISVSSTTQSLSSATPASVTSISLTAGDWDVRGAVSFSVAAGTTLNWVLGGISLTNNTIPAANYYFLQGATNVSGVAPCYPVPMQRISLATTTTVYLVAESSFSASTVNAGGFIEARRVR